MRSREFVFGLFWSFLFAFVSQCCRRCHFRNRSEKTGRKYWTVFSRLASEPGNSSPEISFESFPTCTAFQMSLKLIFKRHFFRQGVGWGGGYLETTKVAARPLRMPCIEKLSSSRSCRLLEHTKQNCLALIPSKSVIVSIVLIAF